ncbi:MAG: hypothetical protein LBJ82_04315 [Deltaproteobacteria bacterium]|jgi:hypothetical protein|nr:hypothetical protein [Deltaproteobacteria bacterium]
MKRSVLFLLCLTLACLCALNTGCKRTVPINDLSNPSLSSYGNLSNNQVRDAIIRAGSKIGWLMQEEKKGLIVAKWDARDHSVTVEIPYSAKEYKIHYRSSVNMLDDGNGQIHRNYDRWVARLYRNINAELAQARK